MKAGILLVSLFLVSGLSAQQFSSEWQWLNPKPAGFNNHQICFADNDNGFILNFNGDLIRTKDGGNSWNIQQNFALAKTMHLKDSTGIIAGFSNFVYITTDKGTTWQKKKVSDHTGPYFPFVQVVSRDTLFALNSNNYTLYRSSDKGATWIPVLTNTLLNNNLSLHFVNSRTGFLGGYGGLYKTSDGGANWNKVYSGSGGFLAVNFFNEKIGFAFREYDRILKTTDGGLTWTGAPVPFDVFSFFFIDADTAYAAGEYRKIYKTTDGGASWQMVSPWATYGGYNYNSICFLNDRKGFVVGSGGWIESTEDGGRTWKQHGLTYLDITTLRFVNKDTAYATDWWTVYKSTDKGQTWQPSNLTLPGTNSRFTHSWFKNRDTGFLISSNPLQFYKTYDGGQSWQAYYPFQWRYDRVFAMDFVNDSTGYIFMYFYGESELFKTTNGGETWKKAGTFYPNVRQIQFVTEKNGFVLSDYAINKTVDSGKTWKISLTEQNYSLNGIHFINEAVGYCFGNNGYMKKTVDSGTTWTPVKVPYGHILNAHFFDQQVGYLTNETYNNGILKTYDGGQTWHPEGNVTSPILITTTDSLIYGAGKGGAILRQKIKGYNIDSVSARNISPCAADITANISAAYGTIDGVWLEYGINGFATTEALTPFTVTNGTIKPVKKLTNLLQDTTYMFRLKFLYEGTIVYTEEKSFSTWSLPKPAITPMGDSLFSSTYSNNQWFFNGVALAGATGRGILATEPGTYTVQFHNSGCSSEMSEPYNFDPVLEREVLVVPNPVTDFIYIKNKSNRLLAITVHDINGRKIRSSTPIRSATISIPVADLGSGIYIITITDTGRNKSFSRKVIKQRP